MKGDGTQNSIKAERNKAKAVGSEVGTNDTRETTTVISLVNNWQNIDLAQVHPHRILKI